MLRLMLMVDTVTLHDSCMDYLVDILPLNVTSIVVCDHYEFSDLLYSRPSWLFDTAPTFLDTLSLDMPITTIGWLQVPEVGELVIPPSLEVCGIMSSAL
jgi:hypothetical protein